MNLVRHQHQTTSMTRSRESIQLTLHISNSEMSTKNNLMIQIITTVVRNLGRLLVAQQGRAMNLIQTIRNRLFTYKI